MLSFAEKQKYQQTRGFELQTSLCFAPSTYLYLSFNGNAYVCCDNKQEKIGVYPKQTLQEIWQSQAIQKYRKTLAQGIFPSTCEACEDYVKKGLPANAPALRYDYLAKRENSFPAVIDFELSNFCNLACIMCSGEFSTQLDQGKQQINNKHYATELFLQELAGFIPHLQMACFKGGEPFSIPLYYKIWELFIELNPQCIISVVTNGTLLSEHAKKLITQGNFQIRVSIDSLDKKTYETIRANSRFEMVYSNLQWFIQNARPGQKPVAITACPMTMNWQEIPALVEFCNLHNLELFLTTVSYPKELSLQNQPQAKLQEIYQTLAKKQFKIDANNYLHPYNIGIYERFLAQLKSWSNS